MFVSNRVSDEQELGLTLIDFDAVCAALRRLECPAVAEHSGGGCATIYAGGMEFECRDDYAPGGWQPGHFAVAAGPGWFDSTGRPMGSTDEFFCGPDDHDGTGAVQVTVADPDAVARIIFDQVRLVFEGRCPTLRRSRG